MSLFGGMKMLHSCGVAATELRLVGGASRNVLWRQIVAGVLQAILSCIEHYDARMHAMHAVGQTVYPGIYADA